MTCAKVEAGLRASGCRLVERLGGRWSGDRGLCRCPAHDDRKPSLSVRVGRTRLLLHCFAGCPVADILRALRLAGLSADLVASTHAVEGRRADTSPEWSCGAALRIWSSARPLAGTPAQAYLEGRGLATDSPELRFHPRTPDGPWPATRFRPALIAAVRDEAGLVAVQRTFLRLAGRVPTVLRRCALGRLGSGAVRLGGIAPRIALAEGVETALAAGILFGLPCWATLGSARFGRVALPPDTQELLLLLDHDSGGRSAEALARAAFPHARIEARRPAGPGADWNDVLRDLGRGRPEVPKVP